LLWHFPFHHPKHLVGGLRTGIKAIHWRSKQSIDDDDLNQRCLMAVPNRVMVAAA